MLSNKQIQEIKERIKQQQQQLKKYPHDYSRNYTSLRKQIEAEKKYIESKYK